MVLRSSPTSSLITHVGAQQALAQQIMLDRDSFATTLFILCYDRYPEMLGGKDPDEGEDGEEREPWTQDTVWLACQEAFGVELPMESLDKIMAAMVLMTSNFFFQHTPTFIRLCNILGGDDTFNPDIWDPADCFEMAWSITETMLLYRLANIDVESEPFSEEIRLYIGAQLTEEGIVDPPDVLALGIRKGYQEVMSGYSDDPIMYEAMYSNQSRISEEINGVLQSNMMLLLTQLQTLPLKRGETKELVTKLSKGFSGHR
jgi:hypothetical protein